jgi:hypothetical protein
MAEYRQIHNQFWKDSWVLDLAPEHKLLFIYLFSNERSTLLGIFELPVKAIAFETGLPVETVEEGLRQISASGKIAYDFDSSFVWVRNLLRYNGGKGASVKVRKHLERLWNNLPGTCPFKAGWLEAHGNLIDTVHEPRPQEQDQEKEQETNTTTTRRPSSSSAIELFRTALGAEPNRLDRETLAGMVAAQEKRRRELPEGAPGAGVGGEEWVMAAIRVANAARDPARPFTLAFVQAILRRWGREGFQAPWLEDAAEGSFPEAEFWERVEPAGHD